MFILFIQSSPQVGPIGPEFQVNTYTTRSQVRSAIASRSDEFVVVWSSWDQDGDDVGVFG